MCLTNKPLKFIFILSSITTNETTITSGHSPSIDQFQCQLPVFFHLNQSNITVILNAELMLENINLPDSPRSCPPPNSSDISCWSKVNSAESICNSISLLNMLMPHLGRALQRHSFPLDVTELNLGKASVGRKRTNKSLMLDLLEVNCSEKCNLNKIKENVNITLSVIK